MARRVLHTPVYVKLDAHDPLLLSEVVCRQLGIIIYHPDVVLLEREKKKTEEVQLEEAVILMMQVQLLHSVKILPQQSVTVSVKPIITVTATESTWLLEPVGCLKKIGIQP